MYVYVYIYIYITLPQVVLYSLMLYNNISVLYILSGEFSYSFKFKLSSESCKNTTEEVYQDVNESFCIIRSSFLMSIFTHY